MNVTLNVKYCVLLFFYLYCFLCAVAGKDIYYLILFSFWTALTHAAYVIEKKNKRCIVRTARVCIFVCCLEKFQNYMLEIAYVRKQKIKMSPFFTMHSRAKASDDCLKTLWNYKIYLMMQVNHLRKRHFLVKI